MTDRWALLAYRLPREPSSPRIALWRRLRRLGVASLQDGLVGLPLDSRNREQLEWIAEEVAEAGGDAHLWIAEPASTRQGHDLARQLAVAIADEYRVVATDADLSRDADPATRRRTVRRLRRELRRIRARDYFPPPERETATRAVDRLAALDTPAVRDARVRSGSSS
jgi:hypothetical protein